MPDKYHYGFDLGNGKDESCLTIFRDEDGDTQVVEAVLYGKQAESVFTCLRSHDEQHRREVEVMEDAVGTLWFTDEPLTVAARESLNQGFITLDGFQIGLVKTVMRMALDNYRTSQLGSKEEKGG